MNSHVCEVGEYMDERYGQVTCDVARDESLPSQHWTVHRQYPAHVVTPKGRERCTGWAWLLDAGMLQSMVVIINCFSFPRIPPRFHVAANRRRRSLNFRSSWQQKFSARARWLAVVSRAQWLINSIMVHVAADCFDDLCVCVSWAMATLQQHLLIKLVISNNRWLIRRGQSQQNTVHIKLCYAHCRNKPESTQESVNLRQS